MSQIDLKTPAKGLLLLLVGVALAGCGDANSKAVFGEEHPAGWSTGHQAVAKANVESCVECHGDTLQGGISTVSCTSCHLGGPESVHPTQWAQYAYARHKQFVQNNGTLSCANEACHGATLQGVAGSGPSCAAACHLGGATAKHPAVWTQYSSHANYVKKTKSGVSTSCKTATCHGTDGKGVFLSGPACDKCHSMK